MIAIDLRDRVALVTGGARGIGAAVCRRAAQAGAAVAVLDMAGEESCRPCQALAEAICREGGRALALAADVTSPDELRQAVGQAIERFGRIDVLVTCAGTTSRFAVADLSAAEWRRIQAVNLDGTFYSVQAVLPHVCRHGRGAIILIGSAAIVAGSGGGVHYAASKAALEGLCRGLTRELGTKGVRTNLIHPSLIDTELLRHRHPDPQTRGRLAGEVPVGRLGQPEDIANLAVFLASDLAGYITGQAFYVDGGRTFCRG